MRNALLIKGAATLRDQSRWAVQRRGAAPFLFLEGHDDDDGKADADHHIEGLPVAKIAPPIPPEKRGRSRANKVPA